MPDLEYDTPKDMYQVAQSELTSTALKIIGLLHGCGIHLDCSDHRQMTILTDLITDISTLLEAQFERGLLDNASKLSVRELWRKVDHD